jgi:SAM-dependent methyltransferase
MAALLHGQIAYRLLKWLSPGGESKYMDGSAYHHRDKMEVLLGRGFNEQVRGKTIIGYGCGSGKEIISLIRAGASLAVGLDTNERLLAIGEAAAAEAGLTSRCRFVTELRDFKADLVVSLDAFEHFSDPSAVLGHMRELLKPDGQVLAAFGPTWYHPLGGHLFSVFPWSHLVFSEAALIRWRSDFKNDGATRFSEVEGGLNGMTIRRFERIVTDSPFRVAELRTVPIRKLRFLHNKITREFTTAVVRCTLSCR